MCVANARIIRRAAGFGDDPSAAHTGRPRFFKRSEVRSDHVRSAQSGNDSGNSSVRPEHYDPASVPRLSPVSGTETIRSRREVPLTRAALDALEQVPPRLDSRYVFTTSRKCPGTGEPGPFDVARFRRREWGPAIDAAGIAKPARLYDLRSTFASNVLAAGITMFELARIMGTSVKMIELHYGALLDTAHESLLDRLNAANGR